MVNREPTDVGKRISAIIKARQEEVAKFLPSDRRAKVYGIVNANIRKMVRQGCCVPSPGCDRTGGMYGGQWRKWRA